MGPHEQREEVDAKIQVCPLSSVHVSDLHITEGKQIIVPET